MSAAVNIIVIPLGSVTSTWPAPDRILGCSFCSIHPLRRSFRIA